MASHAQLTCREKNVDKITLYLGSFCYLEAITIRTFGRRGKKYAASQRVLSHNMIVHAWVQLEPNTHDSIDGIN